MKNKIVKLLSWVSLLLSPILVFAEDSSFFANFFGAIFMEAFVSIHMSVFVLSPLSKILKTDPVEQKKIFWKMFWIRAIVLLIFDCIVPQFIMVIDFLAVFVGAFIIIPISSSVTSKRGKELMSNIDNNTVLTINTSTKCPNCGAAVVAGDNFCTSCGTKLEVSVSVTNANGSVLSLPSASQGAPLNAANIFGYNMSEEQMATDIITNEITKMGENINVSIEAVEKKKNKFSMIYAVILFICLSLFFFHSHTSVLLIVFAVITLIYINSVKNYNIVKYLQKEVQARPDEKISYIVSSVLAGKTDSSRYKVMRITAMIVAIIIPMFLFRTPHIIYEKQDDGYVIRFYTVGWLENDEELEIPAEYKGEPVVGIRGDVFANVKTIEKVVLPDTIKEIRGGAFQYASNLEEINLPEGIPEIKGNTFEGCNLKEITIPDSVTRIGGHAFRENYSLEKVNISANSKLVEIGSSAFRDCSSLDEIYLPRDVNINERAFKDSGTVVKEYATDGLVFADSYKYSRYIYMNVGEAITVQDYTVKLERVEGSRGDYTFVIYVFKNGGGSQGFPLYRDAYYKILNDYGIALVIDNDYMFDSYDSSVGLTVYYN